MAHQRSFLDIPRYSDVAAEVDEATVTETDPEVMQFLARLSLICMTKGDDVDLTTVIQRLSTGMFWMIVMGRGYHARGYAAPIARTRDAGAIPDYITTMFGEDN